MDIYVDVNSNAPVKPNDDLPFTTTLYVRDHCLCLHVQRAARALARRFDDALRPTGLSNGQFSLMMSLNRPDPPGIASIASLLAMDRTTLTANLKPLERRGLIKIGTAKTDKRKRTLELTPSGQTALIAALPIWRETHRQIGSELGEAIPERLRADLIRLS